MPHRHDTRGLARRAEALRNRLLRRWLARGLRRLAALLVVRRAEAELRALDARGLRDLGLDPGGIAYAARYGREEAGRLTAAAGRPGSPASPACRPCRPS